MVHERPREDSNIPNKPCPLVPHFLDGGTWLWVSHTLQGDFKCFLMRKNYIIYTDGVGENRLTSVGSLAVCSVTIYAINYQIKTCRRR